MTSQDRKKLPARYAHVFLPLVITFCMTFLVSGISTIRNLGLSSDVFFSSWLEAWGISWLIAFPVLLVILPMARKIVFTFVESS